MSWGVCAYSAWIATTVMMLAMIKVYEDEERAYWAG